MRSVITVVGARPQFVKAAPLVKAFSKRFRHTLIHTGQHFDDSMSGAFFRELDIGKPDVNLAISSGSHGQMTGAMIAALEDVFLERRPDAVVVMGDTNTTLAGALAAVKLHTPVAHVEAGLRSFDMKMPEEVNRRVVDHVSSLLFCPSVTAAKNLKREGIAKGVAVVGDVMVDVMRAMRKKAPSAIRSLSLPREFYFATVHRQENTDDPKRLAGIVRAFGQLPYPVVLPLHPRTKARLKLMGALLPPNVHALEPVTYAQSLGLSLRARAVLTDSGGLQKEAFLLGRTCITLRDTTEWVETLSGGANRLVGWDPDAILRAVRAIERKPPKVSPGKTYGDGRSSERIARAIDEFLR